MRNNDNNNINDTRITQATEGADDFLNLMVDQRSPASVPPNSRFVQLVPLKLRTDYTIRTNNDGHAYVLVADTITNHYGTHPFVATAKTLSNVGLSREIHPLSASFASSFESYVVLGYSLHLQYIGPNDTAAGYTNVCVGEYNAITLRSFGDNTSYASSAAWNAFDIDDVSTWAHTTAYGSDDDIHVNVASDRSRWDTFVSTADGDNSLEAVETAGSIITGTVITVQGMPIDTDVYRVTMELNVAGVPKQASLHAGAAKYSLPDSLSGDIGSTAGAVATGSANTYHGRRLGFSDTLSQLVSPRTFSRGADVLRMVRKHYRKILHPVLNEVSRMGIPLVSGIARGAMKIGDVIVQIGDRPTARSLFNVASSRLTKSQKKKLAAAKQFAAGL